MSLRELVRAPNAILVLNLMAVILVCALAAVSRLKIEYLIFSAAAVIVLLCKRDGAAVAEHDAVSLMIFPALPDGWAASTTAFAGEIGMVVCSFLIINLDFVAFCRMVAGG